MNTKQVKKRMKDLHITAVGMAEELGVDPSTYFRKMKNNGAGFSAMDLLIIKRVLNLNEQDALDFLLS